MSGNTDNAGRWPQCDVYVADAGSVEFPASPTEDAGAGFDLVGFLDGSAGVVKSLDEDSSTLKAWGGVPVEQVNEFNGESFAFTAIEDNDVVWSLVYAGSPAPTVVGGITTRVAKIPNRKPKMWLIRLTRSNGVQKDYQIPKGVGSPSSDITENETDLGGTEITVNVISNNENTLHSEVITGADDESSSAA